MAQIDLPQPFAKVSPDGHPIRTLLELPFAALHGEPAGNEDLPLDPGWVAVAVPAGFKGEFRGSDNWTFDGDA